MFVKTFKKFNTELGDLYFFDSGVYSYAVTAFGVLATKSVNLEWDEDLDSTRHNLVKFAMICNGIRINDFVLELPKPEEVRLYAKRSSIEVPEAFGGFKFGSTVFRTIMVPTSEVPVFEVPFEAQHDEASSEVLIGLA